MLTVTVRVREASSFAWRNPEISFERQSLDLKGRAHQPHPTVQPSQENGSVLPSTRGPTLTLIIWTGGGIHLLKTTGLTTHIQEIHLILHQSTERHQKNNLAWFDCVKTFLMGFWCRKEISSETRCRRSRYYQSCTVSIAHLWPD